MRCGEFTSLEVITHTFKDLTGCVPVSNTTKLFQGINQQTDTCAFAILINVDIFQPFHMFLTGVHEIKAAETPETFAVADLAFEVESQTRTVIKLTVVTAECCPRLFQCVEIVIFIDAVNGAFWFLFRRWRCCLLCSTFNKRC